jgi:hypothetical protein
MTTPAAGPTLSVSTDKTQYNVGDTLTLTVAYADAQSQATSLNITVTGTDSDGNAASVQTNVMVVQNQSGPVDVSASDTFGQAYSVVSNDGSSQAVLQTQVGAPPSGPIVQPS